VFSNPYPVRRPIIDGGDVDQSLKDLSLKSEGKWGFYSSAISKQKHARRQEDVSSEFKGNY
jgi:hypothetical protein